MSLLLAPALAIVVAACGAGGASNAPSSADPSAAPSTAPSGTPAADAIEHKTGATDIVLRYEEGGVLFEAPGIEAPDVRQSGGRGQNRRGAAVCIHSPATRTGLVVTA